MASYRVTVDTGGTFSDFVYLDESSGELSIAKFPSTPDDPSRAILAGIEALRADRACEIGYFCHGTTVGTNALLEEKGAGEGPAWHPELGLLTTGSSDFHGPEHPRFHRFLAHELHGLPPRLGPIG